MFLPAQPRVCGFDQDRPALEYFETAFQRFLFQSVHRLGSVKSEVWEQNYIVHRIQFTERMGQF